MNVKRPKHRAILSCVFKGIFQSLSPAQPSCLQWTALLMGIFVVVVYSSQGCQPASVPTLRTVGSLVPLYKPIPALSRASSSLEITTWT